MSTVDPDARHVHKTRSHYQDGYKAHVAVEPETGLFTAVALTPGSGSEHHEAAIALDLLADQEERRTTPGSTPAPQPSTCEP